MRDNDKTKQRRAKMTTAQNIKDENNTERAIRPQGFYAPKPNTEEIEEEIEIIFPDDYEG